MALCLVTMARTTGRLTTLAHLELVCNVMISNGCLQVGQFLQQCTIKCPEIDSPDALPCVTPGTEWLRIAHGIWPKSRFRDDVIENQLDLWFSLETTQTGIIILLLEPLLRIIG
jgi:hypothetical protein